MKKNLAAMLFAVAVIATPAVRAQDRSAEIAELQKVYAAAQADKKSYVASMLDLTAAEGKKFWPVYGDYQRDLDMFNRRRNVALEGLIARDKPLSDLYAKTLAAELLAVDEGEIKSRRTMQNRMLRALPPKKAVRYLQIESKIRAVEDYNIAVAFPFAK